MIESPVNGPQDKEPSQSVDEALCREAFRSLCHSSMVEAYRKAPAKNSAREHKARELLLQGLDAESLALTRRHILEHWPK